VQQKIARIIIDVFQWMIANDRYGSEAVVQDDITRMSAFPNSGHSVSLKSAKSNVRFRPLADVGIAIFTREFYSCRSNV